MGTGMCCGLHARCLLSVPAMTVVCRQLAGAMPIVVTPSILLSSSRLCEYGGVVGVDVVCKEEIEPRAGEVTCFVC